METSEELDLGAELKKSMKSLCDWDGEILLPPKCKEQWKNGFKQLKKVKNFYIAVAIPLIFLPIPLYYGSQEMRCAYVCLVTILYLITQSLPLSIASLMPLLMFPLFGILTMKEVSSKYFQDPIVLFFASVIIARAIQMVNLHKRIALNLLIRSGSKPVWMVFGFMMSTFFISMWINNSATAVLMAPVASGVIEEMFKLKTEVIDTVELPITGSLPIEIGQLNKDHMVQVMITECRESAVGEKVANIVTNNRRKEEDTSLDIEMLRKCIFIAIAYSCNVGGTASLTGTPPNLIMTGILNVLFGPEAEISFSSWFFYAFPGALIIIILTWLQLCIYFFGFRGTMDQFRNRGKKYQDPRPFIRLHLQKMGKFKQNEITVSTLFMILLALWIFKNPKFIPGWLNLFKKEYVSDGTPAILIAIILFIVPRDFSCLNIITTNENTPGYKPILVWSEIQDSLMWDINLLFGGGLAMALGFSSSGLSKLLVKSFYIFHKLPKHLLVLIFSTLTSGITEVLNNIATASIIIPIVAEIAVSVKVNPIYFILPVTLAASFCFMLPIGTAPNAICYASGKLNFLDMVKPGFFVHIICLAVTYFLINTYADTIFHVNKFPDWAAHFHTNATNGTH